MGYTKEEVMGNNFVQFYITSEFQASFKRVSILNPKPEP